MITETMLVIAVPDLQKSAAYYKDILGFQVFEIGDPGWRKYVKDNCYIMAGECSDALPPAQLGDHSYFCYLVVESVDDYYSEIKAKYSEFKNNHTELISSQTGVSIPPEDRPWQMREFAITTIDGHRIMVGEKI